VQVASENEIGRRLMARPFLIALIVLDSLRTTLWTLGTGLIQHLAHFFLQVTSHNRLDD
jgi:hypothetical protein